MVKKELKCPACGMTFTADTEEELKKLMREHSKKHHS